MRFHCTSQSLGVVESHKKCWKHLFVFLKLRGGILETVCAFSLDFSKFKTSKFSYKILKTCICIYKFRGRGILQRRCAFSLHFSKFMTYAILKTLEGIEVKFMRYLWGSAMNANSCQVSIRFFLGKKKIGQIWRNSSRKCYDPALFLENTATSGKILQKSTFIENIAKSREKSFINA